MAQKIKIKPRDSRWNDDFLKEHVGEKVVLCMKRDGELYEDVLRFENDRFEVERWIIGESGCPENFFDYLEIYPKEDSLEKLPNLTYTAGNYSINETEDLPDEVADSDDYLKERFYGRGLPDSFVADEAVEYFKTQPSLNNLSIKEKTMNVIKSAFKSKEVRALEHFGLTNGGKDLNDEGLDEFLAFLWETADKDTKNAFYKLVVDRYNEAKKRD